jgi:hypothetical protein
MANKFVLPGEDFRVLPGAVTQNGRACNRSFLCVWLWRWGPASSIDHDAASLGEHTFAFKGGHTIGTKSLG